MNRPNIPLGSRIDLITQMAGRALEQAGPEGPVYRCGGILSRVREDGLIEPWTTEGMRARLASVADFQQGERPVAPPAWLSRGILDVPPQGLPALKGVTRLPVFRPPNTLILDGYEERSQLVVRAPAGVVVGRRDEYSNEQLTESVLDPWREFPFVNAIDKATLLAACFTLVRRNVINGPVPVFGVAAPRGGQGTGKTFLMELLAAAALGTEPEVLLPLRDESEMRKRLLAIALASPDLILLDNLTERFDSPSLAAAVTGGKIIDRVLGSSKIIAAEFSAVWALTGNELSLTGDIPRRALAIHLNAGPSPHRRRFDRARDALSAETRKNRAAWVGTVLTLVERYYQAGCPDPNPDAPPHGSFEAWDREVRRLVMWLGHEDPVRPPPKVPDLTAAWKRLGLGRATAKDIQRQLGHLLPPGIRGEPRQVGLWLRDQPVLKKAGRSKEGVLWELSTD